MLTVWGSNRFAQLGRESTIGGLAGETLPKKVGAGGLVGKAPGKAEETDTSTFPKYPAVLDPTSILQDDRFVAAAAGDGHSLFVNVDGELFAVGRGSEGQLGLGTKRTERDPVRVDALSDEVVVNCAAGAMHSLAVTSSGKLFMWGLVHVASTDKAKLSNDGSGDDDDDSENVAAAGGDAREMLGITGSDAL